MNIIMELRISFQSLVTIQYLFLQIKAEEKLHWNSNSKDVNLIAPDYLPESKKENRRLAVIVPCRLFLFIVNFISNA